MQSHVAVSVKSFPLFFLSAQDAFCELAQLNFTFNVYRHLDMLIMLHYVFFARLVERLYGECLIAYFIATVKTPSFYIQLHAGWEDILE